MSKNYSYAFENLIRDYQSIAQKAQSLDRTENLSAIKEELSSFHIPKHFGTNTMERWQNLNLTLQILVKASHSISVYNESNASDNSALNRQQMELKLINLMLERYEEDLSVIIEDFALGALFESIKNKDLNFVSNILTHKPELIQRVNVDGWGPIHFCAAYGNKEILKILVDTFHADVNQRTEYFYTPVHLAAKYNNIECIVGLMQHNADTTLSNNDSSDVFDFMLQARPELESVLKCQDSFHLEVTGDQLKIVGDAPGYDFQFVVI
jgi:ankyrin repeat protein